MEAAIEETLLLPERVVQPFSDRMPGCTIGSTSGLWWVESVVVRTIEADAFVLTAYLTDRIKKGVPLWPASKKQ
jgi:hypothetical protein